MNEKEEFELELEEQFILRLPLKEAEKIRSIMKTKPEKLKKYLKIDLDLNKASGIVKVGKKKLYAYLKKFPTILETYKTNIVSDCSNLFKTADVSYMLECFENQVENFKTESPHGYTLPLKNVKKNRFRKTLVNPDSAEETQMITKELYYLLSTDLEAVSTRFEVIEDEITMKENRRNYNNIGENGLINEKALFGHLSSSDSELSDIYVDFENTFD